MGIGDFEQAALTPDDVAFDDRGLVPCIVQDFETRNVLMMAWMNRESLRRSIEGRTTWFWSRSRGRLWHKGEESGNTQELVALHYDCDADTLLALVRPAGPACHTGAYTCFYRTFDLPSGDDGTPPLESGGHRDRGLTRKLGVRTVEATADRVRMEMPIVPSVLQPAGFLHGGATITLLESCASLASWLRADLEGEYSFGSHVDVRHVNAAKAGILHGEAVFDHAEDLGERGRKEFWRVAATSDGGVLNSTGVITTRTVSKEYFSSRAQRGDGRPS